LHAHFIFRENPIVIAALIVIEWWICGQFMWRTQLEALFVWEIIQFERIHSVLGNSGFWTLGFWSVMFLLLGIILWVSKLWLRRMAMITPIPLLLLLLVRFFLIHNIELLLWLQSCIPFDDIMWLYICTEQRRDWNWID